MMTRAKALQIRALAVGAAAELDDAHASSLPEMFPGLKGDGSLVKAGTRINWNGQLKKAAADLWDTTENNPDNAPDLGGHQLRERFPGYPGDHHGHHRFLQGREGLVGWGYVRIHF